MNLFAITNSFLCPDCFLEQIKQIAKARPYGILLREKELSQEAYLSLACSCQTICNLYNVPLFIHSNIAAAKTLGISNIHFSFSDFLNYCHCEKNQTHFSTIGTSIHSLEEALLAEELGANYIIAGHIFETDCKKGLAPRGISFLEKICYSVSLPVFAIGGITIAHKSILLRSGAAGVCMMSSLMQEKEPEHIIQYYQNTIDIE